MALKFNLANQLMSPEQMAGFGQSFGESLGGMGMALSDAWSNYQAEQDRAASIVDTATGRVPSTFEAEDTYEDFLEFDETIDDPSDVNLGENIGRIESWYEKQARETGDMNINPLAFIGGKVTPDNDNVSDIKNMRKIPGAPTEETPTQEDKDTFIKEHGIDAYNALMEKRFRKADSGMYSDAGFQRDRRELTKFAGDATNLLGAVDLRQDLSKVQNPINYNPETEYNFQQGLKPNIFGTALNNLGR